MRKLGEQWIEELDGKKHMLKAVTPIINGHPDIKDLGILNDDGLLPCPFCGEYPSTDVEGVAYCNTCGCDIDLDKRNRRA